MDLLKVVIIFSMVALSKADGENIICPDNEIPQCESGCAPTCQNRSSQEPCTEQCRGNCSCKDDYIREGPGGMCVQKGCKDVPICKKHEIFQACPTACPRICDQISSRLCPKICRRVGCTCEDGYVRESALGKCIPESKCNQKCGDNESYDKCGSGCPGTCAVPHRACDKRCYPGCFCNEGYILDDNTFKCIRKENCPKTCN